jgi:hypothetical protein
MDSKIEEKISKTLDMKVSEIIDLRAEIRPKYEGPKIVPLIPRIRSNHNTPESK